MFFREAESYYHLLLYYEVVRHFSPGFLILPEPNGLHPFSLIVSSLCPIKELGRIIRCFTDEHSLMVIGVVVAEQKARHF